MSTSALRYSFFYPTPLFCEKFYAKVLKPSYLLCFDESRKKAAGAARVSSSYTDNVAQANT